MMGFRALGCKGRGGEGVGECARETRGQREREGGGDGGCEGRGWWRGCVTAVVVCGRERHRG